MCFLVGVANTLSQKIIMQIDKRKSATSLQMILCASCCLTQSFTPTLSILSVCTQSFRNGRKTYHTLSLLNCMQVWVYFGGVRLHNQFYFWPRHISSWYSVRYADLYTTLECDSSQLARERMSTTSPVHVEAVQHWLTSTRGLVPFRLLTTVRCHFAYSCKMWPKQCEIVETSCTSLQSRGDCTKKR